MFLHKDNNDGYEIEDDFYKFAHNSTGSIDKMKQAYFVVGVLCKINSNQITYHGRLSRGSKELKQEFKIYCMITGVLVNLTHAKSGVFTFLLDYQSPITKKSYRNYPHKKILHFMIQDHAVLIQKCIDEKKPRYKKRRGPLKPVKTFTSDSGRDLEIRVGNRYKQLREICSSQVRTLDQDAIYKFGVSHFGVVTPQIMYDCIQLGYCVVTCTKRLCADPPIPTKIQNNNNRRNCNSKKKTMKSSRKRKKLSLSASVSSSSVSVLSTLADHNLTTTQIRTLQDEIRQSWSGNSICDNNNNNNSIHNQQQHQQQQQETYSYNDDKKVTGEECSLIDLKACVEEGYTNSLYHNHTSSYESLFNNDHNKFQFDIELPAMKKKSSSCRQKKRKINNNTDSSSINIEHFSIPNKSIIQSLISNPVEEDILETSSEMDPFCSTFDLFNNDSVQFDKCDLSSCYNDNETTQYQQKKSTTQDNDNFMSSLSIPELPLPFDGPYNNNNNDDDYYDDTMNHINGIVNKDMEFVIDNSTTDNHITTTTTTTTHNDNNNNNNNNIEEDILLLVNNDDKIEEENNDKLNILSSSSSSNSSSISSSSSSMESNDVDVAWSQFLTTLCRFCHLDESEVDNHIKNLCQISSTSELQYINNWGHIAESLCKKYKPIMTKKLLQECLDHVRKSVKNNFLLSITFITTTTTTTVTTTTTTTTSSVTL